MKKLKNIGEALLYIVIYFAVQTIVVTAFAFFAVMEQTYDMMLKGELDYTALYDLILKSVTENSVLLTVISNAVFVLTVLLIFVIRKKNFFREIGLMKPDPRYILPVIALGASMNVLINIILSIAPFPQSWWDEYNAASAPLDQTSALTIVAAVIVAPLTEELLFRGLVFTRTSRALGVYVGMVASSLIFGFMHGTAIWFIYTALFGLVLAFVFYRSRSLVYPILLHLSFNLTSFLYSDSIPIYVIILAVVIFLAAGALFISMSGKAIRAEEAAMTAEIEAPEPENKDDRNGQ